jgi:predicted phage terminase large subunit-like protein
MKKQLLRNELRKELARRNFWQFCLYYDKTFFTKRAFLKPVAAAFQQIEDKEIKSLSVSMPPRAGKSYITSLYCAWSLGKTPTESVMRNTCTNSLYLKFSYDVRAIFKSDKYMEVFKTRLSNDKSNLTGWNTNSAKMVSYFGAGVGGTIIGFGASKVAITDDLYKGLEDALSDTINDRIIQWKEATHDSRFETGCARIDIGTRWSTNDMIGRQLDDNIYDKSIIVAALNKDNKSFCEAVMTTDEYIDKRNKTPKEIWLAEYQQTPVDLEGRLFSNLQTITQTEYNKIKEQSLGAVGYIDVADAGKDYTALAIGNIIGNKLYITDTLFSKQNTDYTIPLSAKMLNDNDVKYCRVESNSMGAMFSRQLQRQTKTKILQVANTTNKITRIIMQTVFIQNNMVFVEQDNPNYHQFINNVYTFSKEGKNKNDDAPDCLAGLSLFATSMFRNIF